MCIFRGFQKSLRRPRCSGLDGAAAEDGGHAAADGTLDGGDSGPEAVGDVVEQDVQLLAELVELLAQLLAEGVEVVAGVVLVHRVQLVTELALGRLDGVVTELDVTGGVLLGEVAAGDEVQPGVLDGQLTVGHQAFQELDETLALLLAHGVQPVEQLDGTLFGHAQRNHTPLIDLETSSRMGLPNYIIFRLFFQEVRCCYAYFHKSLAYIFIERSN